MASSNPLDSFYNKSTASEAKKSKTTTTKAPNSKMIIIVVAVILTVCCLSSTCVGVLYATGVFDKVLNKDEDKDDDKDGDNKTTPTPTPTNKPTATPEETETPTYTPTTTPTTTTTPTDTDGKIGDWVTLGDIDWKVTKVENLGQTLVSSTGYDDATTDGTFIKLFITINNKNNQDASIMAPTVLRGDESFYSYDVFGDYINSGEKVLWIGTITANTTENYVAIYEITGSTDSLIAEIMDLAGLSSDYAYIDLSN